MKIIKIAQEFQEFQDEGHNAQESPENETFQNQQEMENKTLGKKGPTYTADLLNKMTKSIGPRINSAYVANGSVAWIEYNDIIYEVTVSPAAYGHHFNFFQSLQNRSKETQKIDGSDNIV